MGRIKNWLSLDRGLIRLTWNKVNLFNMAKKTRITNTNDKTLYQQMWQAKKETRGYHDAEITEKKWKKIFASSSRLPTTDSFICQKVDAGAHPATLNKGRLRPHPRPAALTFAALERRLDFVVFRALLAHSIRHAKQMILHGKVTINGQKVKVSSTFVQDGDIIQVDPSSISVLFGDKGTDLEFHPPSFSLPFMFLPPYLEVDYSTCSVVFLRSPVSRPGKSEIPSPFPPEVHALAYEYYAGKH
ncbi:hypothetical protein DSO57_1002424 [Entomophthora muscae]|uniref:Uncharacterized protein n=1 Tax=Entomophthora muscae TaxID=34485 RepID=A0ACC2SAV2_9FUNG|nr:hypothetical protein DSO57_1002424 [Entomophthora muscae]